MSVLFGVLTVFVIFIGVFSRAVWALLLITIPMNVLSYTAITRRDTIQVSVSGDGIYYRPLQKVIVWQDIVQVAIDAPYLQLKVNNFDKYCGSLPFPQRIMWKLEDSAGWGVAINTSVLEHTIPQYLDCIRRLASDIPIVELAKTGHQSTG